MQVALFGTNGAVRSTLVDINHAPPRCGCATMTGPYGTYSCPLLIYISRFDQNPIHLYGHRKLSYSREDGYSPSSSWDTSRTRFQPTWFPSSTCGRAGGRPGGYVHEFMSTVPPHRHRIDTAHCHHAQPSVTHPQGHSGLGAERGRSTSRTTPAGWGLREEAKHGRLHRP